MTAAKKPEPPSYAFERPYDYAHPTTEELEPFIGVKWVIGRRTPRLLAEYPDSIIVSPQAYVKAQAAAIEARGWGRHAEKVIRDLIDQIRRDFDAHRISSRDSKGRFIEGAAVAETLDSVREARLVLEKARTP